MKASPAIKKYVNNFIIEEINILASYFSRVLQWQPLAFDDGYVFENINTNDKKYTSDFKDLPSDMDEKDCPSLLILNGNLNYDLDIEKTLREFKPYLSRDSRIVAVLYSSWIKWIYGLIRNSENQQPSTFVTNKELKNIVKLAGYEVVKCRHICFYPFHFFGLGDLLNSLLTSIPLLCHLSFVRVITLRPVIKTISLPSISIVIPARNEKGNIENALKRIPNLEVSAIEIIFVEGHSNDGTWEEILRVKEAYSMQYKILAFQQTGFGKVDAVRLGFSKASSEILTILDADLTMPPEILESFYSAYREGHADFINGNRLVYPMEGQAMRFLNKLGNLFFAKALSYVMSAPIGDSLCGTKLVSKYNYQRFVMWRNKFGDFDPFGDFELLFPASELGLGIIDIPVHYKDRTYGTTNISRFKNGFELLRMTCVAYFKMKIGRIPKISQRN